MASDFGGATALFQVFKTFCFPLLILSMISIFWQYLVHGLHEIDPRYGSYFFASIGAIAMNLLSISFIFYFCTSLDQTARLLLGISYWIDNFFWNFSFVFMMIALRINYGWLMFWKDIFIR